MNAAIFQPIVSIDADGKIDTDWFQSYIWTVDDGGNEVDDFETETGAIVALDERLAAIEAALVGDSSELANLVRPFFEVQS